MSDILLQKNILSLVKKQNYYNIIVLETVNSTNTYAKGIALNDAPHATVVVADSQTNGRGRLGRDFFSPGGTGIYMSVIIKPQKIKIPPSLLTVAGGVAVSRVIDSVCNSSSEIKWVNDVFLNGKKVCGILAEGLARPDNSEPDFVILGIGVNVSTPSNLFPGKLNDLATSIFPINISRNELIAKILNELDSICNTLSIKSLIDEYKSYSMVLGKKISFTKDGKAYSGIASDINSDGNLVVDLDNNCQMTLTSGEVSLGSSNFLN